MARDWINELMNLVAGNSRYIHYSRFWQLVFIVLLLVLLIIPILLYHLN